MASTSQQSVTRYDTPPGDYFYEAEIQVKDAMPTVIFPAIPVDVVDSGPILPSVETGPVNTSTILPPAYAVDATSTVPPVAIGEAGPFTPRRQINSTPRSPPPIRRKQTKLSFCDDDHEPGSTRNVKRKLVFSRNDAVEQKSSKKRRGEQREGRAESLTVSRSSRISTNIDKERWRNWWQSHQLPTPGSTPPSSQENSKGSEWKGTFNRGEATAYFKLNDNELKCLPHRAVENALNSKYAPEKLYPERDVMDLARRKQAILHGVETDVGEAELLQEGEKIFGEVCGRSLEEAKAAIQKKKWENFDKWRNSRRPHIAERQPSPTPRSRP